MVKYRPYCRIWTFIDARMKFLSSLQSMHTLNQNSILCKLTYLEGSPRYVLDLATSDSLAEPRKTSFWRILLFCQISKGLPRERLGRLGRANRPTHYTNPKLSTVRGRWAPRQLSGEHLTDESGLSEHLGTLQVAQWGGSKEVGSDGWLPAANQTEIRKSRKRDLQQSSVKIYGLSWINCCAHRFVSHSLPLFFLRSPGRDARHWTASGQEARNEVARVSLAGARRSSSSQRLVELCSVLRKKF